MMPLDEKDLQLLAEVLPSVSAQLRSSMANVFAAANRLAPAEAREADPMLDKNAAILTMSCHQMLRLVGNLSAASELVQGGRFRLCNGDIVGFCHALCERAEPLFALRGVALRFSTSHESHVIAFNAPMLERALLNLLSNALKFTPEGGTVSVRVKCGERHVQLTVADTAAASSRSALPTSSSAIWIRTASTPRRRTVSASGCPSAAASRRGTAGCSWRNPLSVRARSSRSRCPTPARRICRCPTAALTMPAASTMFSWS